MKKNLYILMAFVASSASVCATTPATQTQSLEDIFASFGDMNDPEQMNKLFEDQDKMDALLKAIEENPDAQEQLKEIGQAEGLALEDAAEDAADQAIAEEEDALKNEAIGLDMETIARTEAALADKEEEEAAEDRILADIAGEVATDEEIIAQKEQKQAEKDAMLGLEELAEGELLEEAADDIEVQ